jgi:hypothetical protein
MRIGWGHAPGVPEQGQYPIGSPLSVKKAVDLAAKNGKNVLQTPALMKYVETLDKKSMFWLAVGSIPAKVKDAPAGGMMPVDLSKAEAFTAVADFKNRTLSGELRLISHNEAGNKQIADMLNGLKRPGRHGRPRSSGAGQLLNSIQRAGPTHQLTFFSEELLNKLGAKAGQGQGHGRAARAMEMPAEPAEREAGRVMIVRARRPLAAGREDSAELDGCLAPPFSWDCWQSCSSGRKKGRPVPPDRPAAAAFPAHGVHRLERQPAEDAVPFIAPALSSGCSSGSCSWSWPSRLLAFFIFDFLALRRRHVRYQAGQGRDGSSSCSSSALLI